jgi:hypothetical protein
VPLFHDRNLLAPGSLTLSHVSGGPEVPAGQGLGQVFVRLGFTSNGAGDDVQHTSSSMRGQTGLKKITAKQGWGAMKGVSQKQYAAIKAKGGCDIA